jgi:AraC-like DNA-binding protein
VHERLTFPPGWHGLAGRHEPHGRLHHWHRHDEPEFNLVVRGSATYLLGRQRCDLTPGCLIWLFPAQDHLLVELSADFVCYILAIRPAVLARAATGPAYAELRRKSPTGDVCRPLAATDAAWLQRVCADAAACMPSNPQRGMTAMTYAFLVAWDAFQRAPVLPTRDLHPAVERAAALIGRDPAAALTGIARHAGLSESRLSRLFHAQVGTTLVAWRSRQRVERFLTLIQAEPQRRLLDLALRAGFGSYAQAHRAVRAVTGKAPAALAL